MKPIGISPPSGTELLSGIVADGGGLEDTQERIPGAGMGLRANATLPPGKKTKPHKIVPYCGFYAYSGTLQDRLFFPLIYANGKILATRTFEHFQCRWISISFVFNSFPAFPTVETAFSSSSPPPGSFWYLVRP